MSEIYTPVCHTGLEGLLESQLADKRQHDEDWYEGMWQGSGGRKGALKPYLLFPVLLTIAQRVFETRVWLWLQSRKGRNEKHSVSKATSLYASFCHISTLQMPCLKACIISRIPNCIATHLEGTNLGQECHIHAY